MLTNAQISFLGTPLVPLKVEMPAEVGLINQDEMSFGSVQLRMASPPPELSVSKAPQGNRRGAMGSLKAPLHIGTLVFLCSAWF